MLELVVSSAFKTEVKKIKNAKDKAELKLVLDTLLAEKTLDVKYRDHALSGNYENYNHNNVKKICIATLLNEDIIIDCNKLNSFPVHKFPWSCYP